MAELAGRRPPPCSGWGGCLSSACPVLCLSPSLCLPSTGLQEEGPAGAGPAQVQETVSYPISTQTPERSGLQLSHFATPCSYRPWLLHCYQRHLQGARCPYRSHTLLWQWSPAGLANEIGRYACDALPSPPRGPVLRHQLWLIQSFPPSTICSSIGSYGFLNLIKFLISPLSIILYLNRQFTFCG